jgi:DUF1680 family protein
MSTTALSPIPLRDIRLREGFWYQRQETNRRVTLAVAYAQLEQSGTFGAYQWQWDPAKPPPRWRIWVGDLGKWIEAASYSLATHADPELEARTDVAAAAIIKGQKPDGYLYSNPLPPDQHWADLQEKHQLYDLGHTVEGAIARWQATGKRDLLDALCRMADLVAASFGHGPGQIPGYDGHPEVELALVRLYRATGERRYLDLARYFVDERGREPNFFVAERAELERRGIPMFGWYRGGDYSGCQAHKPVREQTDAVGHAVRALYLYSGMADVAAETGDAELFEACRRLWQSVTRRRMYVTGGIGSSSHGEAFTFDYDLPNETAYAETCAGIALVFFAQRLLQIDADAEYADVMERALYNGVLSGVSQAGDRFFYGNRLTVYPQSRVGSHESTADRRREWFGCACCPPNLARLIADVGQYMVSTGPDALYVHLYGSADIATTVDGAAVRLREQTQYPWRDRVRFTVKSSVPQTFTLALRIPGWCRGATLCVNGQPVDLVGSVTKGYAHLRREWRPGDRVDLRLPMPVERVEANPRVRMDCGKVALQRGPVVYCLEEADNGPELADLILPRKARFRAEFRPDLLGGTMVLRGKARRRAAAGWDGALYRADRSGTQAVEIVAVPYCLWANRAPGEMMVWLRSE